MKRIFAIGVMAAAFVAAAAQSDNTVYVKTFPGETVGAKVTAAMATCTTNTAIPCILVIDPSLAAFASGTLPTMCANCYLQDFRTGPPSGGGGYAGVATDNQDGLLANGQVEATLFVDNSRIVPVGPSLFLTGSDNCARIQNGLQLDYTSGIKGMVYSDSVDPYTLNCSTPYFPSNMLPSFSSPTMPVNGFGTLFLQAGAQRGLPSRMDIPLGWDVHCNGGGWGGGTNGTGCLVEPGSSFLGSPYGLTAINSLINLGCPLGVSGSCFSLGSRLTAVNVNCEAATGMIGVTNLSTQQRSGIVGNSITDCTGGGIFLGNQGTSGGSQNQGEVSYNDIAYAQPSTNIVMVGMDVTNQGSGYTSAPTPTVTGCGTAPSFQMVEVLGTWYGQPEGTDSGGICNSPSGVSISFSGGGGTGMAASPVLMNLGIAAGLYQGGGGTLFSGNSIVAEQNAIPMLYGSEYETGGNEVDNEYVESSQIYGHAIDILNTSGTTGNVIVSPKCSGANEYDFACVGVGGGAWPESFAVFGIDTGSGSLNNFVSTSNPMIQIPQVTAGFGSGNGGGTALVAQDADGTTLSTSRFAVTTAPTGAGLYNCGSGGCTSTTAPHQYMPVTIVNGAVQAMTVSTTNPPVGIAVNGSFTTSYTEKTAYAASGLEPIILDGSSFTIGDCVVPSTTAQTPVEGHDAGSATCPAGEYHFGWIADLKSAELTSIPSAPSTPTATASGGTGSRTISYEVVEGDFGIGTLSPPSTAATVTNAAAGLGDGNGVTVGNLSNSIMNLIYRTSSGDASLPTGTFVPDANGEASYYTIGTASGPDCLFPPSLSFSGGSCTTEPKGTAECVGGYWTGVTFVTRGVGCSTTGTITATASPYETGLIHRVYGATSWTDTNAPGDGSTPPAAGQLAPMVDLNINLTPGASLTNPMTSQGQYIYGGASGLPTAGGPCAAGQIELWTGSPALPTCSSNYISRQQNGYGVGTATASATLYLSGLGGAPSALGWTGTESPGAEMLMPAAGTLSDLSVRCATHGIGTAGQEPFTLWYDRAGTFTSTGISVSYDGTVTANTMVQDTTDTFAYNAGDKILIKVTTQASETLANCGVAFNY